MDRDILVCIGKGGGWTAGVRYLSQEREFSLFYSIEAGSGIHRASYPMGIEGKVVRA
jgi:hypothetical protein